MYAIQGGPPPNPISEDPTGLPDSRPYRDDRLLSALMAMGLADGGLLPNDSNLLVTLWPGDAQPSACELDAAIVRLSATGALRPVVVGREMHLAAGYAMAPSTNTQHGLSEVEGPDATDARAEQQLFELQVEVDVENERVLLYRILATLGAIGFALLARQTALSLLGL